MSKVQAYVFADHHAGGGYPQRGIDDSYFSLEQIITRAIADDVEHVISLGDAVDSVRTHADAVVPLRELLALLVQQDIEFSYIDGNHDRRNVSWLHGEKFTHLDKKTIEVGGRVWYGLDYRPREEIKAALKEVPLAATGVFTHQAWGELLGWDTAQCVLTDLPEHVTHVCTGDFHGLSLIKKIRLQGKEITLINPGSTSVQNIDEPPEKNVVAIREDGSFALVPLVTRPVIRSSLLITEDDLATFVASARLQIEKAVSLASALPKALQRPLLQVRYMGDLAGVVARVEAAVGDRAHLFWKEVPPTPTGISLHEGQQRNIAVGPLDVLDEVLGDGPLRAERKDLVVELLRARSKQEISTVLERWWGE